MNAPISSAYTGSRAEQVISGAIMIVIQRSRLVAAADRLRRTLDWRPQHDNLDIIVGTALAWETRLAAGRTVVTRGGFNLRDGDRVAIAAGA